MLVFLHLQHTWATENIHQIISCTIKEIKLVAQHFRNSGSLKNGMVAHFDRQVAQYEPDYSLDVIECFEDKRKKLRIGELLNKQAEIYDTLGVTLPTSSC